MTKPKTDESTIDSFLANRYRHIFDSDGGKLTVTNRRIIFKAHAFNFDTNATEIAFEDIASVTYFSPWGLLPNGIEIKTYDGKSHQFVTWKRDKVRDIINEHLPKTKRTE
jgi:hypothetical protein